MSTFTETIRERLSQEHRSLDRARAERDLYAQDLHEAELEHLYRIACNHGVHCPGTSGQLSG
jgi:hypothetical protein